MRAVKKRSPVEVSFDRILGSAGPAASHNRRSIFDPGDEASGQRRFTAISFILVSRHLSAVFMVGGGPSGSDCQADLGRGEFLGGNDIYRRKGPDDS